MILSANGLGGNQEGLASVLLQECLCNSHGTQPCLKPAQEGASRAAGCCPALSSAALSSNSCSFSLIPPKKASVSTEEPGEGSLPCTKTHTRLPSTQQIYCSDELILSRQQPQGSAELCLNPHTKVSRVLKTNESTGCENQSVGSPWVGSGSSRGAGLGTLLSSRSIPEFGTV